MIHDFQVSKVTIIREIMNFLHILIQVSMEGLFSSLQSLSHQDRGSHFDIYASDMLGFGEGSFFKKKNTQQLSNLLFLVQARIKKKEKKERKKKEKKKEGKKKHLILQVNV